MTQDKKDVTTIAVDDPNEPVEQADELKLTPEQREEVQRIFKTLEKKPLPPKKDFRKIFKVGGKIRVDDPRHPVSLIIRTVGQEALGVELDDRKRKFVNGSVFNVNGIAVRVTMAKKRHASLVLV